MLNKKSTKFLFSILVLSIILVGYQFNSNLYAAEIGTNIALDTVKQLEDLNIEYIKIVYSGGSYTEHWRDLKNLEERSDTFDTSGTLINSIIVKESGERVISIGNDNGQIKGSTWVLPKNIASINKELLKKSLFEDVRNELKSNKWKYIGKENNEGKEMKKITSSHGDISTILYIDQLTGYPVKREIYENEKGNLRRIADMVEEYKKISDESGNLFKCDNIELKETPAPGIDTLGEG